MPELIKCRTLITYIIARIRKHSLFSTIQRAIRYARRFIFVTRILGYIRIAAAIIETSAVLIIFSAALIVAIPVLAVIFAVLAAADRIIGTRLLGSSELDEACSRERIYIIADAGSFGDGFARELSDGGATVFVLTASPTKRFICAARLNGVYYVRHAFFFRLKRRRLVELQSKTVYLM